ncbi:DUF397 domain-containing protein [Streptomyces sp. E11-3]|uniref:DUF397 domain-containing protein n=1 Tax=Streptomyces sp. E11-3 TaxID=3110112 RepID=UPI0039816264
MAELSGVLVKPRRQRGWRKSSRSGPSEDCLEMLESSRIQVRDSKFSELGQISFGVSAWTVFVTSMRMPPSPPD